MQCRLNDQRTRERERERERVKDVCGRREWIRYVFTRQKFSFLQKK